MTNSLFHSRQHTKFKLIAWVVMPEHVHLVVQPALPEFPIPTVLRHLKQHLSNRVLRRWRELNAPILHHLRDARGKTHFWQLGGGYDRNIRSLEEYEEKVTYIHNNPVQRGLVAISTDWRWSSARWYVGCHEDVMLPIDRVGV